MSKNKILITIAIPFFNAEEYLAQAIQSVLAQTYHHWILLLVDDGSRDQSLAIAEAFAEQDARIKVYSDGANRNLGYRLNQIPTLVDTEYLARMDADDIMHPARIGRQIETLLQNPSIDVLGTNAYSIDENSNVIGIRQQVLADVEVVPTLNFIHPTIMAKTSWFVKNPYDVKALRVEDAELWARTARQSVFMQLTESLFFYREYNGDYYKKYWLSLSGQLYVWRKNRYSIGGLLKLTSIVIKTAVYFVFERILKSKFLITRRNHILFKEPKVINDFI